jgi:transposase
LAVYRQSGIQGLLSLKRRHGRQATIPAWAIVALKKRLSEPKGFASYGAVQQWLSDTLGVDVSYMAVYRLVRGKLKAKLKVAKRQSTEQDPDQLHCFKSQLANNLDLLKQVVVVLQNQNPARIRYWCQDETRWSLTTVYRRLLTAIGVKPVGKMQWVCEGFWLYGVVEPLTGEQFFYEFSHLDSLCFQRFITLFAQQHPQEFHIWHLDRASAHVAKRLQLPKNLLLLFQPSHCPELNPIERLWLHLKDAVRWELFADLEVLRTTLRQRLAQLTQEVVKSLTGWNYILDALFVAGIS